MIRTMARVTTASGLRWAGALLLLAFLFDATPAAAQATRRQPGNEALMRAQQLLQQVAAEKDALQAKNAKLEADKKALGGQLADTKKQLKDTQALLERYHQANDGLKTRLDQTVQYAQKTQEKLVGIIGQYKAALRKTEIKLQKSQNRGATLDDKVADQAQQINDCEHKNLALYKANVELLNKYNHKGVFAALLQHEPFTGIKEVEIENVLQEYRDKLADNRFRKKAESGQGAAAGAPASSN